MEQNGENQNNRWPQYLAALSASIGMFCAGIHYGWPGPSLPRILSKEYPFNITKEAASYITIIGPIGDIAGTVTSSLLIDRIGRKFTIILIGLPQITSMTMIYLSRFSEILLYTARFIGGISEGACLSVLPIYVCEITHPEIRGALGTACSLNLILGILFVNIVGSYLTIYTTSLIALCCSLVFVVLFSFMSESPYYLIMKDRIERARLSLRKLRGRENIETELSDLISDVRRQMSEKVRFRDLIVIKSNRMAFRAVIILGLLHHFSGIASFTFYAQLLFREVTDAIPPHFAAILMIGLQVVFTLISVLVVDRVGRKPLLLISIGGCCLTLIFNSIFFGIRDLSLVDVSDLNLLPLVGLIFFIIFYATAIGPILNLMVGELFPAGIKAKASCIMNIITALSMVFCTKFYQYTSDNCSLAIPFLFFGLCQFVGFILCCRYVPETMNKSLEQIQQELKKLTNT